MTKTIISNISGNIDRKFVNGIGGISPIPISEAIQDGKKGTEVLLSDNISLVQNIMSSLVKLYYDTVDSKDFNDYKNLYGLFSDDIVYDRCNLHLDGKQNFINFFNNRFNNLDIFHTIDEIIPFKNQVIVIGKFSGKNNRTNKKISGDFIDIHEYDVSVLNHKRGLNGIDFVHNDVLEFMRQYGGVKKRRTYLKEETIKSFYLEFEIKGFESSIISEEIVEEWENGYIQKIELFDDKGNSGNIVRKKFIRLGIGFDIIDGILPSGEEYHTVNLFDFKKGGSDNKSAFDSSLGSEIII